MSEIQAVFQTYGPAYRTEHALPPHHQKTMNDIKNCRTATLGGHIDQCDHCGHMDISYNSCRNRHCPKCQNLKREEWLLNRERDLLDVGYFHVVFTIPSALNPLVRLNQKTLYDILFQAASETLLELAAASKYLGAQIGFISLLHTWGQNLMEHPHIHCILPGGGLSFDGLKWVSSRKKFFIPVKVLARKFRGKFLAFLKAAFDHLFFGDAIGSLRREANFRALLNELYRTNWVVYCKPPFKSPAFVLRYLGRYTHRVAIANSRIVSLENDRVTFKWRDYRDNNREKLMTVSAFEFIRRFLLHVLPPRFVKIRYFGILSNRTRKVKIRLCQRLLGMAFIPLKPKSRIELLSDMLGFDPSVCRCCGKGKMVRRLLGFSDLAPPA
ncbi:IS91 family transposase [Hydrogenispora ethanolica]|nr:IS91 family transposase [Hydrogenispora ethanolica]